MAPWGRWTPQSHALFPPGVRAEIRMLLLLRTRLALPISRDLLIFMIQAGHSHLIPLFIKEKVEKQAGA